MVVRNMAPSVSRYGEQDADEWPKGFFTAWPSLEISARWTGGAWVDFLPTITGETEGERR